MTKTINGSAIKILIYIAGILMAAGVYCATVRQNTERIDKVEIKANSSEKDIIGLKKDISYIKEGVDDIKDELKKM